MVTGSAGGGAAAAAEAFSDGEVGGMAGASETLLPFVPPSGQTTSSLPLALNTMGLVLSSMSIWVNPNLRALARNFRFKGMLTGSVIR